MRSLALFAAALGALGSTAAFSLVVPRPCRGAMPTRPRPLLMKEELEPEEERSYEEEYRYKESRADFEGEEAGSYDYHFQEASPNEEVSGYRLGYGEPKRAKLDMDMLKKYGVAGTVAYILTELAFWAVAFPVAAALLYQTTGHWPDVFQDDGDRGECCASRTRALLAPNCAPHPRRFERPTFGSRDRCSRGARLRLRRREHRAPGRPAAARCRLRARSVGGR